MKIFSMLNGIYPRSEALVAATRDHDRGRISDEELARRFEHDYSELIALQQEAGLDFLTDGLLNWQDLFRPFTEVVQGWEPGALVRYFDNNTFYRRPQISGALKLKTEELPKWITHYFRSDLMEGNPWKAILPSPYFTAQAAQDDYYRDPITLMHAYVEEVLIPLIGELGKQGVRFIQFQEPWLVFYRSDPDASQPEGLKSAFARLRSAVKDEGITWGLYTYFGDGAPHLHTLLELEVEAVGVDFVETDLEALEGVRWEKGLIAGCLDVRNSWVEPPEQVLKFAERALEVLDPPVLYLTPNADFEFLPEAIARKKTRILGEAARRLKEAVT